MNSSNTLIGIRLAVSKADPTDPVDSTGILRKRDLDSTYLACLFNKKLRHSLHFKSHESTGTLFALKSSIPDDLPHADLQFRLMPSDNYTGYVTLKKAFNLFEFKKKIDEVDENAIWSFDLIVCPSVQTDFTIS